MDVIHIQQHCVAVSLDRQWAELAAWQFSMEATRAVGFRLLQMFWDITSAQYGISSASMHSFATTPLGTVGIGDPGIVLRDPHGKLARNTAYHLLQLAIEVGTGHRLQVTAGAALLIDGGPEFYDHYRTLRGRLLIHTPPPAADKFL